MALSSVHSKFSFSSGDKKDAKLELVVRLTTKLWLRKRKRNVSRIYVWLTKNSKYGLMNQRFEVHSIQNGRVVVLNPGYFATFCADHQTQLLAYKPSCLTDRNPLTHEIQYDREIQELLHSKRQHRQQTKKSPLRTEMSLEDEALRSRLLIKLDMMRRNALRQWTHVWLIVPQPQYRLPAGHKLVVCKISDATNQIQVWNPESRNSGLWVKFDQVTDVNPTTNHFEHLLAMKAERKCDSSFDTYSL